MKIDKETSFIGAYFTNKSGEDLKKTITPTWTNEVIKQHLKIIHIPEDTDSVCEVGCGIARLLRPIYKSGVDECYGFDASQDMVDESKAYIGRTGINIRKCSGDGDLELKTGLVDFSFSIITFQYIPNTETVKKYISEMKRVTKIGGVITFQLLAKDLNRGYLWSYHDLDEIREHLKIIGISTMDYSEKISNDWVIFRCLV